MWLHLWGTTWFPPSGTTHLSMDRKMSSSLYVPFTYSVTLFDTQTEGCQKWSRTIGLFLYPSKLSAVEMQRIV